MAFAFLLFLLVSLGIGIAILWFYSGSKSDEIKTVLKASFSNLKALLGNLKDLFIIIKSLVESEAEPSQEVLTNTTSETKTSNAVEVKEVVSDIASDSNQTEQTSQENSFSQVEQSSEIKPPQDVIAVEINKEVSPDLEETTKL